MILLLGFNPAFCEVAASTSITPGVNSDFLVSLDLTEQAGILFSRYGSLDFQQYRNDLSLNLEFGLNRAWWIGFNLGYVYGSSSRISAATPLIMPGFDVLHFGLLGDCRPGKGLIIRLNPYAAFAETRGTGLFYFFLGGDLAASWLFRLGWLGLEPGLGLGLQFRKDTGPSWSLSAQLHISLQGSQAE